MNPDGRPKQTLAEAQTRTYRMHRNGLRGHTITLPSAMVELFDTGQAFRWELADRGILLIPLDNPPIPQELPAWAMKHDGNER